MRVRHRSRSARSGPPRLDLAASALAAAAFTVGIALRISGLGYETSDATNYLLPWYAYALEHGIESLGHAFTNYAPAYSYLLLLATGLDGWAAPLTLIKGISFAFELACALVAGCLAAADGEPGRRREVLAFAVVWLAPCMLHNGAFWGQADAIWTLLLLLALLALVHGGSGWAVVAFATAISVKAQGFFLAPLGLALLLRGDVRWRWLLAIPLVQLTLALPTLLAGRPLASILGIYLAQAGTFGSLTMNAANLYVFVPPQLYGIALPAGLAGATLVGALFARMLARGRPLDRDGILLAGAACLMLMPFVLPKMHERFFYAGEIVLLVLAVRQHAFLGIAALAQVTSALSYLPFDGFSTLGIPIAALINLALIGFLLVRLRRALAGRDDAYADASGLHAGVTALLVAFLLQLGLLRVLFAEGALSALWPFAFWDWRGLVLYGAILAALLSAMQHLERRRPAMASTQPSA